MSGDQGWFLEKTDDAGFATGLKIRRLLHEEKTPYQTLAVYETEHWGNLMTLDGLVMLTSRDNFVYHEMMSHPALFTHPDPKRVAIVGGGDCGTLREVLRHRGVEEVIQIEIDEAVTRAAEQYFPELTESNGDPRAKLMFVDALQWMKDCETGSLDVIVIDSTDPIGPAVGLFQREFYSDCLRALGDTGLIVQQSESPLVDMEILLSMRDEMSAAGFAQLRTYQFCQPTYPTGWWTATMASTEGVDLMSFRKDDAKNAAWQSEYYSADMHQSSFAMPPFFERASKTR